MTPNRRRKPSRLLCRLEIHRIRSRSNGEDGVPAAQLTNAARLGPESPTPRIPAQANRSVQSTVAVGTSSLPVSAAAVTCHAHNEGSGQGRKRTDTVQPAANGDNKPVHVSAPDAASPPQPDAPAPPPQVTPPPVLPQGVTASEFGVTASAAGAHSDTIATALHIAAADADPTPNFGALAVSIAARSLSGAKQFEIRLDPPELGRVEVRLSIDASGKTQAHMTADQPQTLGLLQKDAPTLTQALRDAGLDVSQSGLNFSLRGQDRQMTTAMAPVTAAAPISPPRASIQAAQSPTRISFNGAAADARVDIHV